MRRLVLALGALAAIGVSAILSAVTVPATTAHAVMTASPSMVSVLGDGPNGNCVSSNGGASFTCTIHLHETSASTEPMTWTGTTDGSMTATYVPASGTLHPGQTVTVKAIAKCVSLGAFIFLTSAAGVLPNGAAVVYACG